MKNILFILLIALGTTLNAVTLILPERQAAPGNLIQVPINLAGADSVAGGEMILQFDPAALEFVRIDSIGLAREFLLAFKLKDDQIAISMARATASSRSYATLLGLVFRIKKSLELGAATELTWKETHLYAESTAELAHQVEHGVIRAKDLNVFPNPFTPNLDGINDIVNFVVPDSLAGTATAKIYGIAGELVRELADQGTTYMQWDGRNEDGVLMMPGVYLYLIQVNGKALKSGTITLMR